MFQNKFVQAGIFIVYGIANLLYVTRKYYIGLSDESYPPEADSIGLPIGLYIIVWILIGLPFLSLLCYLCLINNMPHISLVCHDRSHPSEFRDIDNCYFSRCLEYILYCRTMGTHRFD